MCAMKPESLLYAGKIILAPMVRIGTLPMRLLSLKYGADLVFTEETIDHKLLKCRRVVNRILDTVDFIDDTEDTVVFRTSYKESDRVILQIGTSDAERALTAAKLVEKDVAGIDINMGCPKEFSIKGGMGAALLSQPEKVKKILTTLVLNISKPISCKIRVLPELQDTIEFCKMVQSTGVVAITIHGRTKEERPRHSNRNEYIKAIAKELTIPVIANGGSKEILEYSDIEKFREETGASSVMLARAAMLNCSIFRKEGKLSMDEVIISLLKLAVDYENHPLNTKYGLQQMFQDLQESPLGRKLLSAKTLEEICELWDLDNYCRMITDTNKAKSEKLSKIHSIEDDENERETKRHCIENVYEVDVKFIRHFYKDVDLPKTKLLMLARQRHLSQPKYETEHKDKLFKSVVRFDDCFYTPFTWEKNKRTSEQAAALACLTVLSRTNYTDNKLNNSE